MVTSLWRIVNGRPSEEARYLSLHELFLGYRKGKKRPFEAVLTDQP